MAEFIYFVLVADVFSAVLAFLLLIKRNTITPITTMATTIPIPASRAIFDCADLGEEVGVAVGVADGVTFGVGVGEAVGEGVGFAVGVGVADIAENVAVIVPGPFIVAVVEVA